MSFWDNELMDLESRVIQRFGAEAARSAIDRAGREYRENRNTSTPEALVAYRTAIKDEFRQLIAEA